MEKEEHEGKEIDSEFITSDIIINDSLNTNSNDYETKINKKEYDFVKDFEFTLEMEEEARKIIDSNSETIQDKFLNLQQRNWDKFYKFNTVNFFKDRHYILAEFPELRDDTREEIIFLDIGCGVGNSFYPLVERKQQLIVNGFDISNKAIEMSKTHRLYDDKKIHLCVLDIVKEEIPLEFKKANYSILMFVLSAIMPISHELVIKKIYDAMDTNSILYFRDYARYDMAQVRFSLKKKNKIDDNLYMRYDKTLAYYFDQKEIEALFEKVGFKVIGSKLICRLIENRKDNKKMHRLWLQVKLQK